MTLLAYLFGVATGITSLSLAPKYVSDHVMDLIAGLVAKRFKQLVLRQKEKDGAKR